VITGGERYPENITAASFEMSFRVPAGRAHSRPEAGETRAVNLVLVGALSVFLPIAAEAFLDVISARIPERFARRT